MAVQTYDQAYGDLGAVYDPQIALIQQQRNQAQTDATAQQASLEQAKVNAFRDIDTSANRKGILFSGFSPDQQAQYVGTKYLPAVANLKSTLANSVNTANSRIAQLYGERSSAASKSVMEQTKNEQDQAYKQAQLGLSYARLGVSQSNAANSAANKAAAQFQITQKKGGGGYAFSGPNGRPLTLAQYVTGIGGDANDVLDLLKQGSTYDKGIYKQVNGLVQRGLVKADPASILSEIARNDVGNYYGLK